MDGNQYFQRIGSDKNPWDVVVVGAGPAGALAALLLARHGLTTLLVERKKFPRDKVCGGCLSARGVAILRRAGLSQILSGCDTAPIERLELYGRHHHVTASLRGGVAILRSEFDARLVNCAQKWGATFLAETTASVAPQEGLRLRRVKLSTCERASEVVNARVVLACDGLGNSCVSQLTNFKQIVSRHSRIGVGTVIECEDDLVRTGSICMAIGRCGYVGQVRLGDRRISLAAALDPRSVRELGATVAVQSVLEECGLSGLSHYSHCRVHGTIPLTRHSTCLADESVFLVGDACGYVEPFTGEGMALALEAAEAIVPFVIAAKSGWQASLANEWERAMRKITRQRQALCHGLSDLCRRPWLVDATLALSSRAPKLFGKVLTRMNHTPQEVEGMYAWDSTFQV